MDRSSRFSYLCNACGLCCRNKVVPLSPYDLLRIARAAGITTGEARGRFTIRRGSILKFAADGACPALAGSRCTLHPGRPLACRLYPLGMERDGCVERFIALEPAPGSVGVYGDRGEVGQFLATQGVAPYLEAIERYRPLIGLLRERVAMPADLDKVEPCEFRRRAFREATAESGFDPNPLIDALFDPDALGCARESESNTVTAHLCALEAIARREPDPERVAAAAVMLAISLGYPPGEAIAGGATRPPP
ncbi:MAG: YkgJ family cysteine cluster protein [Candidatus Binataceae bacterium]